MRLTLALDFALTRGNRMQDPSKPDELMPLRMIAFNVITTAVAAKYPKGIDDLSANATWARVQRHLNRAVDDVGPASPGLIRRLYAPRDAAASTSARRSSRSLSTRSGVGALRPELLGRSMRAAATAAVGSASSVHIRVSSPAVRAARCSSARARAKRRASGATHGRARRRVAAPHHSTLSIEPAAAW